MRRPFILLFTLALAGPLFAAPVAVVTEYSGAVKITRAGKPLKLKVGLNLEAGDRVQAGGGRAVLFFLGAPPKTVAGNASFTVAAPAASGGQSTWSKVYTGLSHGLSGQSRTVAAAMRPGVVAPIYPQNTLVLENCPTFIWDDGGANAEQYEITVGNAAGVTLWTAKTNQTRLQYPVTAPPLTGNISWRVLPLDRNAGGSLLSAPAKASPQARFRMATAAEAARMKADMVQVEKSLPARSPMRALARAVALHDGGFVGQALQELSGQTEGMAGQLRAQWLAESRVVEPARNNVAALLPDVEVDPSQVPEEVRKTYVDAAEGYSVRIPVSWGTAFFDLSQFAVKGEKRAARLICFGSSPTANPTISVAVEDKPQPGRALLPLLNAIMSTNGTVKMWSPRRIQFQDRPATATDWDWTSNQGLAMQLTSIEFDADGRRWVLSAIDSSRKTSAFTAVSSLLPTWKLAPKGKVPAPMTFEALLAEMKEGVLANGDEINGARRTRANMAPTRDLAGALKALAAAPPDSREAAGHAREAAGAAATLAWDALQNGDSPTAQKLMTQRQDLLNRTYAAEKAFYLRGLSVTDRRIQELAALTPPLQIAEAYNMVLTGWMGVQGFRVDDLALLARDNGDLETREVMARRELEYSLRQLRMTPYGDAKPEVVVDKRMAVIRALGSLGDAAEIRAEYDEARAYYKRDLELRRALAAPPEKREEDSPYRDLGYLESRVGNTEAAIAYYKQALTAMDARRAGREAQIQAASGDLQTIMRSEFWQGYNVIYNNLGILVHGQGDYEAARRYYEQSIEMAEKMPAEGPAAQMRDVTIARSRANLATLLSDSGLPDEAKQMFEQAIDLYRKVGDDDGMAFTTLNLAGLINDAGDAAGARQKVELARTIFAQVESPRGKMGADIFLCRLERQDGNFERAAQLAQEALGIARAQGDQEYIATAARALADSRLRALGDTGPIPQDRLDAVWAALREAEAADGKSNQNTSIIYTASLRAKIQERTGDWKGATDSLRPAIDRLEAIRASVKSADAFSDHSSTYSIYEQMVRVLLKQNRADEAFDYLQRARSKKLQDNLRLSSVKSPNPAIQQLLDRAANLQGRLQTVRAQLADEQALPEDSRDAKKVENLTALVASTQAEFFNVSNQLKDKFPNYEKVVSVKPKELKKAQRTLPPGALLLQYAPLGDTLYIFAVTRDDLKIYTPPVQPAVLKAKIREFRQAIDGAADNATKGITPTLASDPATRETLTSLYDMLLQPVAEDIAKADIVAIIPTQELYYLPFHALAHPDATAPDGLKFFIEEKPVAYLAAADVLSVVQSRDEARLGKGLLALGDPAAAGQPGSLPEARQEVTAIAKLYPAAEALVGDRATKAVLLEPGATKHRALHLAAHGVLDAVQPDRSFIQLAPSGRDDGKLRVGEIYGLDLNAVDLVTLSACRTALGEGDPDGSEITSLAESFSSAGTPTVVASLWSVEDQSTRKLMEAFYNNWAAGKPKAASMRAAQVTLLQNPATRHPFYWAPFEVLGDWR